MHPAVKVRESVGRCTTPAVKTRKVQDTWLLNKAVFWRLSKELRYKTKIFCFGNESFSRMVYECVRESVRARDTSMTCEHSCRNPYVVAQCACND